MNSIQKMIGSPLTSAQKLREETPYLMWKELKSGLSRQYSSIAFDCHATQAFAHLQIAPGCAAQNVFTPHK